MGYSIKIGNAIPVFHRDMEFEDLSAYWDVEPATSADAPAFENDSMTGMSNGRHPSYTGWSNFLDATGLRELFSELFVTHPGCVILNQSHYDEIHNALENYKQTATQPPGFLDGQDYNLARLMWLEFWVRWALENCETPAIRNI
jgi:hypothetical protein